MMTNLAGQSVTLGQLNGIAEDLSANDMAGCNCLSMLYVSTYFSH